MGADTDFILSRRRERSKVFLGLLCGPAILGLPRLASPYINEIFQQLQQLQ
jgi:hypothetical protein